MITATPTRSVGYRGHLITRRALSDPSSLSIDAATATAPPEPVEPDQLDPGDGIIIPAPPGGSDDPRRSLLRRLRFPLGVSLILQLIIAAGDRLPSVDGTAYFEAGRNLINGNGFTREGGPELHFPPLTPLGLALLEKLTGSELGGLRAWNFLCSVLVVTFIVLLAKRIWRDDSTTVATAWLGGTVAGLTPLFTRQGGGSESAGVALLLAGAYFALGALGPQPEDDHGELRRILGLLAAGLAVGLAYLARPESLLPGGFIGIGIFIEAARRPGSLRVRLRRIVIWSAAFGLAMLVCVFPYLAYLHGHTGQWSPTAKSQDASIQAWRAVAENNRLERDRVLYAVNPAGTGLGVPTQSLTALAKADPSGWLGIVWVNIRTLFKVFVLPTFAFGPSWRLLPGFLLVPAGVQLWRTRRRRSTMLLAAMGLAPMVTCVAFFTLPRYLVVTTAVLTLFAARGLMEFQRTLSSRAWRVLLVSSVAFMATSTIAEVKPLLPWVPTNDPIEQAAAGRWIAANTPPRARIMTRSFHVQAYAQRPVVAMPSSDYATMLKFARRMGVDYVVADEATVSRRRPELFAALLEWKGPPGLELIKTITRRGQQVRIFRLDPQSPPSDRPPIPLGYVSD